MPVSKTDEGEGRELRLADTKAHMLNFRLHGLQRPVWTKSISTRMLTKSCSIPKASGSSNNTKTVVYTDGKGEGREAKQKLRLVGQQKQPPESACPTDPGQQGAVHGSLRNP